MIYENKVHIEGILSENGLEEKKIVVGGTEKDVIAGDIKVKVVQKIDDVDTVLEVPVSVFATKFTNAGKPNPAYESALKVKNEMNSIASVGEGRADCVRITGGSLRNNEFTDRNGNFVSSTRVNASFINKIRKEDCEPKATFTLTMVIRNGGYEVDADGVETSVYKLEAIVPQYKDFVDVITLKAHNANVINSLQNYWHAGDTVRASGKLNFSFRAETKKIETAFGEPQEEKRTISVHDLLITGGSEPFDDEQAFPIDWIKDAMAKREVRIEETKKKQANKQKAPVVSAVDDLGF